MKIIRISGCHDCFPYAYTWPKNSNTRICANKNMDRIKAMFFVINEFINSKTLPGNCPLEEEATMEVYDCNKDTSGDGITFGESVK